MPRPEDPEPSLWEKATNFLRRKGRKRRLDSEHNLRESIEEFIEERAEEGHLIHNDERELLGNVLDLREMTVKDVMLPRPDITAIPIDIDEEGLLNAFIKSRNNKIPVYKDTLDDVMGIINIQDVLAWKTTNTPLNLKSMLREVLFISPTMSTLNLIFQMREQGTHMALVVDEHGGIDGLVTLSDLMEEIIGDIREAHEHEDPELTVRQDGSLIIDSKVDLEDLCESFQLDLLIADLEDEVETIGGLVSAIAGHVPVRGEIIKHPKGVIEFEILDADPRRVKRVLLKKIG